VTAVSVIIVHPKIFPATEMLEQTGLLEGEPKDYRRENAG
jgi:hypothetical protein